MSVVFRDEAICDLDEIARDIAAQDAAAADRVVARILRAIYRTVGRLPRSGRLNRANHTREFAGPGSPYFVVYRPVGGVVDVIAIFHASRAPALKRQP